MHVQQKLVKDGYIAAYVADVNGKPAVSAASRHAFTPAHMPFLPGRMVLPSAQPMPTARTIEPLNNYQRIETHSAAAACDHVCNVCHDM